MKKYELDRNKINLLEKYIKTIIMPTKKVKQVNECNKNIRKSILYGNNLLKKEQKA